MWTYSYTAFRISLPIHKTNLLKHLLKENSHFKQQNWFKKKYLNILKESSYAYSKQFTTKALLCYFCLIFCCEEKMQYYSHHVRKFQNNTLGIMQNTAYLIWKGQNRKSHKFDFRLKSKFQWGNFNFICCEAILISLSCWTMKNVIL